VSALRACPFCRTLYRSDEGTTCAECGVALVPMQQLPLSHDALLEEPPATILPEHELRNWLDFSRNRGVLLGLSALGLVAFFLPWVELTRPEDLVLSGFDLARGRAGWLWGGASAYFVLLPLVITRRTIAQLRGIRVAAVLLASLTFFETLLMFALPPRSRGLVPVSLDFRYGIYLSSSISFIAAVFAARLGGALPPLPSAPTPQHRPDGQTLH